MDSVLTTRINEDLKDFLRRYHRPMGTQLKKDLIAYRQLIRMYERGMGDQTLAHCLEILE